MELRNGVEGAQNSAPKVREDEDALPETWTRGDRGHANDSSSNKAYIAMREPINFSPIEVDKAGAEEREGMDSRSETNSYSARKSYMICPKRRDEHLTND